MTSNEPYFSTQSPYGVLPDLTQVKDTQPEDWQGLTPFLTWRGEMLKLLNRVLWPSYNYAVNQWTGPSVPTMDALTLADLKILSDIRRPGPGRLIDQLPQSPLRHVDCATHLGLFNHEDDRPSLMGPQNPRRMYDRESSSSTFHTPMMEKAGEALKEKAETSLLYWFKYELQRPRPHQAALHFGVDMSFERALTAWHPSMISGHCLQGLCGLMGAVEGFLLNNPATPQQETWIKQYFIDFGDRRVMAGIHYPSDNLASWIIALDFCDHVVVPEARVEARRYVTGAIQQSLIYGRILHLAPDDQQPYTAALSELHSRFHRESATSAGA